MAEKKEATVRIYKATNVLSGIVAHVPAANAQEVADSLGWQLGDSFIIVLTPSWQHAQGEKAELKVKVPCQVCPYQYAQCVKPKDETCPITTNAPEIKAWLKQITAAHLCSHIGHSLDKKDHQLSQVWLSTESAIALLASQQ